MAADEACPQCGAIYSRVEAYLKRQAAAANPRASVAAAAVAVQGNATAAPAAPGIASALGVPRPPAGPSMADFVQGLRAGSLYPTFRGLVRLVTWLWYLLAAIAVIGAFFAPIDAVAKIMTVAGALFIIVIATAAREAALMLADLSDAAVITAAHASQPQR